MTRGARRGATLGAMLALLALPVVLAIAEAVRFHARNRSDRTLVVAEREREFVLYVPKRYDRARPTPLVISMHGAGLWGAAQREISRWNAVAEREGFIVAYPSAARGSGPAVWHVDDGPGLMRDVKFIAALIDTLSAEYNIDSTRVYANGVSNGGGMSFVLACTLSHRIAAVGLVAAAHTLPWTWCADHRPVPMIAFHGTADPMVPYDGGVSWLAPKPFPNIPALVANWARRNRCEQPPTVRAVATDVTRREYTHCAASASVVFYTIRDGGHTWPGGTDLPEAWVGRTSHGIDASSVMWAFFREHPLAAHE